jgi:predicted RNA-binding Zn ribbon-like protein
VTAQASIPGEREHPSLALVNSRHNSRTGAVDHLTTRETLREWLAWRSLVPGGAVSGDEDASPRHGAASGDEGDHPPRERSAAPRDPELDAAVALREAIRELLAAAIEHRAPAESAVATVNEAAAAAPASDQLRWDDAGHPRRTRSARAATDVERALAALAEDAIALVCDHRDRLIACEAPGCVRLLLKDHPRRHWCSTRCGDRVRAARYYRRSRETTGS